MDPAVLQHAERDRAEVLVATTWACNLRCTYCFVFESGLPDGDRRMSSELAARVVHALDEGLDDVETICIHLYGGEPLTNLPAVEAMLDAADTKPGDRFAFAVTTNGTCDSVQAIELLERGRFQVILSIDGPQAIHDECRRTVGGHGTHARVTSFLEALRSRTSCAVRGSSVVRSGWRLSQAVDYLRSLPVHAIKAQAVRGPPGTPFSLSEPEREAYLEDLEAIGDQVIADLEDGRAPADDRYSSRVLQLLAGVEREAFCAAGDTTFGITPTGEVLPCILLETERDSLGHIHDPPAAWREAGHRWRASRPQRPECAGCEAAPLCGGGCPAIMPVCGADECDLTRKNCEVARRIYGHFEDDPTRLLTLAGLTGPDA